jgi:hypothetical protein
MAPILHTSAGMLEQLISESIKFSLSEGERGSRAADRRVPGRLSLLQLRELAAAEDVVLPEKARKADYVEAIYKRLRRKRRLYKYI